MLFKYNTYPNRCYGKKKKKSSTAFTYIYVLTEGLLQDT
jgi:hypothetical protein